MLVLSVPLDPLWRVCLVLVMQQEEMRTMVATMMQGLMAAQQLQPQPQPQPEKVEAEEEEELIMSASQPQPASEPESEPEPKPGCG